MKDDACLYLLRCVVIATSIPIYQVQGRPRTRRPLNSNSVERPHAVNSSEAHRKRIYPSAEVPDHPQTDRAMVSIEGENLRPVTWVVIEEVRSAEWGIGGQAMTTKDVVELAKGQKAS